MDDVVGRCRCELLVVGCGHNRVVFAAAGCCRQLWAAVSSYGLLRAATGDLRSRGLLWGGCGYVRVVFAAVGCCGLLRAFQIKQFFEGPCCVLSICANPAQLHQPRPLVPALSM